MSRSGYSDSCDNLNLWRGTVERALAGKRGQAFLRDCLTALDALPEKKLAYSVLVKDGECCAMGAVALARGIDVSDVDPEEPKEVAKLFDISGAMAAEIAWVNDMDADGYTCINETQEQRFARVRRWVCNNLREQTTDDVAQGVARK